MLNKEGSGFGSGELVEADWRLVGINALTTIAALAALTCSFWPGLPDILRAGAVVATGLLGQGVVDRVYSSIAESIKVGNERILQGRARIKREGEQILLLGGAGEVGIDDMVKQHPQTYIPILNNEVAAERIKDNFLRKVLRPFTKLFPFFINLGVEQGGTSVIDTPALNALDLRKKNLVPTPGGDRLVVVSVGGSSPKGSSINHPRGASLDESITLYKRIVKTQLGKRNIADVKQAVLIRMSPQYEFENWVPEEYVVPESKRLVTRVEHDRMFAGGAITIDTTALVLSELATSFPPGTGVIVDSRDNRFSAYPYLGAMGYRHIKSGPHDNPMGEKIRYEKEGHSVVIMVMGESDTATLARVLEAADAEGSPGLQLGEWHTNRVYIFETSEAAELAREAGAIHVWSIAELQRGCVEQMVKDLKSGLSVTQIQAKQDAWLRTRDINAYIYQANQKALSDRVDRQEEASLAREKDERRTRYIARRKRSSQRARSRGVVR